MKRFVFIDAHKKMYSIESLCRVMQVSSGGFRAWRSRPMSQRQRDDMVLLAHIRAQFKLSHYSYGRPRMTEVDLTAISCEQVQSTSRCY